MNRFRVLLSAQLIRVAAAVIWSPAAHAAVDPVARIAQLAETADAGRAAPAYYVSLGDSLSQGIQPDPLTGANMSTSDGYPDQLLPQLRKSHPSLQLVKLDDALPCISSTAVDAACFQGALATIATNLGSIVATLRSNLDLKIVVTAGMTYYDPILAAWLSGGRTLARQSVQATNALNALERNVYQTFAFRVALVGYAFHTSDFTPAPNSNLPINVTQVCSLTWMCALGNIHPNKAGYALIARTLYAVLKCPRR